MSKKGVELWSDEKPYTLREVVVTDEGLVVGFAYRVGAKRDEPKGKMRRIAGPVNPPRYLHVVILGADGNEIRNAVIERVHPPFRSHPPAPLRPYVEQFLVDSPNDRVIVRVFARGARWWWVYRLSTGESLGRFDPRERMENTENLRYVLDARPVAGTPLLLVHWYLKGPDYKVKDAGGRFTLLDAAFNPVWSFDAINDYAEFDLAFRRHGPSKFFEDHPAILPAAEPRRFEIRLFAENTEVAFSVRPTGEGSYTVTELGRIDAPSEQEAEPPTDDPQTTPLAYLGELELGRSDAEESPFRGLWDFTFDGAGRIYFFKRSQEQPGTLYCATASGKIISERPFESGKVDWTQTARMKDGKFFVSRSRKRDDGEGYDRSSAWVELASGRETPSGPGVAGWADGVSRFPDGGFVVLESFTEHSTAVDRLTRYDADGAVRWQFDSSAYEGRKKLGIGPNDVVVTTTGQIVLLEMGSVRFLNGESELIKKINLTGAFGGNEFGGDPGYLHEVLADEDGGFVIANSRNPPVVLRYNADGSLRSRWSPRHPDGKTFDLRPNIRVAPDGRLWTGDGNSIMRLTDDGVVDLVLGPKPQADRLERIAAFTVDRQGNLYAIAHGSGVVHVFDSQGRPKRILEPDPPDVAGTVRQSFIAVRHDGEVYVKKPRTKLYMPPDEYLRFSPAGERLKTITFEPSIPVSRYVSAGWAFQPKTGYRCGICQTRRDTPLVIVDPPSTLIREARRRPNGKWFGRRTNLAMAPNGSMAILNHDIFGEKRVYEVDLFSAKGDPIRTIGLPPPRDHYTGIAYDGRRVVVAGQREVAILDTGDDSIEQRSLTDPGTTEGHWSAFIMPDNNELLLFDELGRKLHRYELPNVDTKAKQRPTAEEADSE